MLFAALRVLVVLCALSNISVLRASETINEGDGIRQTMPVNVEFAFVLLPDEGVSKEIKELAGETLSCVRERIPAGERSNEVTIPHLSLGQYAILSSDWENLKIIPGVLAQQYSSFYEEMKRCLSIVENNIFFETANLKENTNPTIIQLYKDLREQFFKYIITKHATRQARLQLERHADNPQEVKLIEECYQNWGTPEGNRIRPHFTLVYRYEGSQANVEDALEIIRIPNSLQRIDFTHLGIMEIDFWGNPVPGGYVYKAPLKDSN